VGKPKNSTDTVDLKMSRVFLIDPSARIVYPCPGCLWRLVMLMVSRLMLILLLILMLILLPCSLQAAAYANADVDANAVANADANG
jgi:hypothetical protein